MHMKTIKQLLIMITILCILPIFAKAFTSLEISTPNPADGTDFYIQLDIDYMPSDNNDPKIKDFHIIVDYDASFFDYKGVTWLQGVQKIRPEEGHIYIDKESDTRFWSAKTSPVILKFHVKKVGMTELSFLSYQLF